MNPEGIKNILKELPATQYGMALKVFLLDQLEKIDSVDNCKTIEEVKAKQLAKSLIKEIFAFYPQGSFDRPNKSRYT